jgi:hypothetical protein
MAAIPVEIVNPEITQWYECENAERTADLVTSGILAAFGLLQIIRYADLYGDATDLRDKVNQAILACATAEHCFWMEEIFPFMKETFDYICALDNVTPEWEAPLDGRYGKNLEPLTQWMDQDQCGVCLDDCSNTLSIVNAMGLAGASSSLVRSEERRSERRREMKAQGMSIVHRTSLNIAAPGRRAMEASLNISNNLVATASSGINSGLSTFGQGLAGVVSNF